MNSVETQPFLTSYLTGAGTSTVPPPISMRSQSSVIPKYMIHQSKIPHVCSRPRSELTDEWFHPKVHLTGTGPVWMLNNPIYIPPPETELASAKNKYPDSERTGNQVTPMEFPCIYLVRDTLEPMPIIPLGKRLDVGDKSLNDFILNNVRIFGNFWVVHSRADRGNLIYGWDKLALEHFRKLMLAVREEMDLLNYCNTEQLTKAIELLRRRMDMVIKKGKGAVYYYRRPVTETYSSTASVIERKSLMKSEKYKTHEKNEDNNLDLKAEHNLMVEENQQASDPVYQPLTPEQNQWWRNLCQEFRHVKL